MRRSHAHAVDANQSAIVAAAIGVGCDVVNLSSLGRGVPDLAIFWHGRGAWLVELKVTGEKPNAAEVAYALRSRTPVHVVRSVDEILKLIGAIT